MVRPIMYTENFMKMLNTIDSLMPMIEDMKLNLLKARGGNKMAAQRARVAMVKFEKLAKEFRKSSVTRKTNKKR